MMEQNGWDAVVVGGSDPHSSEYPAPRWQQVKWLTGFTAEAGDVVITHNHAGLWTDSRYFIQAQEQLAGTGVELHKTRIPGAVGIPEWLSDYAKLVSAKYEKADAKYPGTGAAGGMGFAFLAYTNAVLESGIKIILEETKLEDYVKDADIVITGEGRLDGQTAFGKAPISFKTSTTSIDSSAVYLNA